MREVLHRDNWPILAAGAALAASVASIAVSQICLGVAIVLTITQWRKAKYPPGASLLLFFFAFACIPLKASWRSHQDLIFLTAGGTIAPAVWRGRLPVSTAFTTL